MVDIPESLLRRSAEAKAKALGVPVEQILAEMKGEAPPSTPPGEAVEAPAAPKPRPGASAQPEEVSEESPEAAEPEVADTEPVEELPPGGAEEPAATVTESPSEGAADAAEPDPGAVATLTEDAETQTRDESGDEDVADDGQGATGADGNGAGGDGKVAAVVTARPIVAPTGTPEGVRTQRLLTVVKARAIQQVKTEPTDKVNTWPHLVVAEFGALLGMTALLVIMSIVIQAPLLEPANFNATPNPSKAPWYFLGLQELLSYFDPQIAGVTVPTIIGLVGFMMIPYVDRNPSTKPSDRKFAIMLFTIFLAGSATLTIIGVLFRAQGFNFAFPWEAGVFFDDLRDWVDFGLH
jgi:menaquinol-cytochrome c reductase cytochrome b/c subunit